MTPAARSFRGVIADQQDMIVREIGVLLAGVSDVALLDFPNHNNVGDNAIWLGELEALRVLQKRIAYVSDLASFDPAILRRRLSPDGVILLHGGGNLGDVWPEHQLFRERLIAEHLDNRIIQLPQSVHFGSPGALDRFESVIRRHARVHFLVRDEESALVLRGIGAPTSVLPDMAFMLGPVARRGSPAVDVLRIARVDHERRDEQPLQLVGRSIETVDWLVGEPGRAWSSQFARASVPARRSIQRMLRSSAAARRAVDPALQTAFRVLARRRVERGLRILSRGRVVVSDRLHGHILATLLGLPQVLLDNQYGKIARYRAAFTGGLASVVQVADVTSAAHAVEHLLSA